MKPVGVARSAEGLSAQTPDPHFLFFPVVQVLFACGELSAALDPRTLRLRGPQWPDMVPDTLHKVWVSPAQTGCLPFREFLSLLLAAGALRPRRTLLHTTEQAGLQLCFDAHPQWTARRANATLSDADLAQHAHLWDRCNSELQVQHTWVNASELGVPNAERFRKGAHVSDLIRLNAINREGGMYIDSDVFLLNTSVEVEGFRQRAEFAMWRDANHHFLNNGFLLGMPNTTFGRSWWNFMAYEWQGDGWNKHSCQWPALYLSKNRPKQGEMPSLERGIHIYALPCGRTADSDAAFDSFLNGLASRKAGIHLTGLDRDRSCRGEQRLPLMQALLRRFEASALGASLSDSCVPLARSVLARTRGPRVKTDETKE